ncbi:MAG: sigma-70 family RNA polymerase sigma factor [Ruminococcaceae bacterium]|nr:sigma-70 family RNA polymerase sigma factor [Oscillospiraceae bacterium]
MLSVFVLTELCGTARRRICICVEARARKYPSCRHVCIANEILMHFRAQKKLSCEVSMSETVDTDRDGNPLTYMDIIKIDDTVADDIDVRWKITKMISFIKEQLSERERQILVMRYGLGDTPPLTQRETAEKLGISRSYISRLEKNALQQIQNFLEGNT